MDMESPGKKLAKNYKIVSILSKIMRLLVTATLLVEFYE